MIPDKEISLAVMSVSIDQWCNTTIIDTQGTEDDVSRPIEVNIKNPAKKHGDAETEETEDDEESDPYGAFPQLFHAPPMPVRLPHESALSPPPNNKLVTEDLPSLTTKRGKQFKPICRLAGALSSCSRYFLYRNVKQKLNVVEGIGGVAFLHSCQYADDRKKIRCKCQEKGFQRAMYVDRSGSSLKFNSVPKEFNAHTCLRFKAISLP